MHERHCVPSLAALSLLIATLAACSREHSSVVFPPDGLAIDSTGAVPRRYLDTLLAPVATVGGSSARDTTLVDPYRLAAYGGRVYVMEGDQRVVAFDTSGRRLWTQGRSGGGPGEYRNVRDLKVSRDGTLWLLDPTAARLTMLDSTGRYLGSVPTSAVGHSEVVVPAAEDRIGLVPASADADIVWLDGNGQESERDSVRWDGFRRLEYLAKAHRSALDPATGRWVLGLSYGNGWFAFGGEGGSERRYYIEPTVFPALVRTVYDGGKAIGTKVTRTDPSAEDLSLAGDTLYVLFGGAKPDRYRKLDLYALGSGHYLGSYRLPAAADCIAVTGRWLYVLTLEPVPQLAVYQRPRG
jgi:hypothetical protein